MSTLETVKKKAPAKKKAVTPKAKAVAAPASTPTREEIARLAEKFWMDRGRTDGSAEQDWLRAERELIGMAS
jgi:hypothetical protein